MAIMEMEQSACLAIFLTERNAFTLLNSIFFFFLDRGCYLKTTYISEIIFLN